MKKRWRRWRPRVRRDKTRVNELPVRGDDIYGRAEAVIDRLQLPRRNWWHRHRNLTMLSPMIDSLRARAEQNDDPSDHLAALILQGPRAVSAQRQNDKHPGGYHGSRERLYELIDFNDTFVSTVLALPDSYLAGFREQAKPLIDRFCKYVSAPCFSNEQWQAITHGLSREIAVYRAAEQLGYQVRMTSRREDAMGVDMVIRHPDRSYAIGIDVKTRSSFHFRLKDLAREGRISEQARVAAEGRGVLPIVNGHGTSRVRTTLLRIDEETYGRVIDFALERPEVLGEHLEKLWQTEGV